MRTFQTGATRDGNANKIDYKGFISPQAMRAFGEYMHRHRKQADGSLRDSDNWKKGIPVTAYQESLIRHVFDLWAVWEGAEVKDPTSGAAMDEKELLCAVLFNAQGILHEREKEAIRR
jgi:hypothetical protein